MRPLEPATLAALNRLISEGPLVERGGVWRRADGSGQAVRVASVGALQRRGLALVMVTVLGRTCVVTPFGRACRRRQTLAIAQRKGARCVRAVIQHAP